jgi:hypothetical protein
MARAVDVDRRGGKHVFEDGPFICTGEFFYLDSCAVLKGENFTEASGTVVVAGRWCVDLFYCCCVCEEAT